MEKTLKIILAVATLLTVLLMLGGAIWGIFLHSLGMSIVCLALAAGFSVFSYHDYQTLILKKGSSPPPNNT